MTDRAEIERLLNQTGRTLEGLPNKYSDGEMMAAIVFASNEKRTQTETILHQSDVIELLVGALRDALAERDAAIKDIPRACGYCKYWDYPPVIGNSEDGTIVIYCEKECHNISGVNTGWEWRGVRKNGDGTD